MSSLKNDINDDEIRIIFSDRNNASEDISENSSHEAVGDSPLDENISLKDKVKNFNSFELKGEDDEDEKKSLIPELKENSSNVNSFFHQNGISKFKTGSLPDNRVKLRLNSWWFILLVIFIGGLVVFFWWEIKRDADSSEHIIDLENIENIGKVNNEVNLDKINDISSQSIPRQGYVEIKDTVVDKVSLIIFTPRNSTPRLEIGPETLNDTTAAFILQAADYRADNGEIVGAYVYKGDLISRGQNKAGYCAIIDGKMIIGVANSTPYLEEAIENGGYFFRQYPLVVGGQKVENQLPYSSLRKALAELNGEIVVIMNDKKQTLNEFSQTLVNLGVSNAIYLTGSTSYGYATLINGQRIYFGKPVENPASYTNYLVWQ